MRSVLTLILAALSVFSANANVPDSLDNREKVLFEARYLKSIFKTDEAAEKLSALVGQTAFDEDALFELADCHFQRGNYESAAATYSLLSANAPGNILYKIRQMQTYSRLKEWTKSIRAGHEVLLLDTIPAVLSFVGDSFRQLEQSDSAIWYYRRSLAIKPHNEPVVAKAVNVFQRQEDIGNDSYPIHFYLGQCYWHTNVLYRAEEELLAAWQIDSSDVNLAYSIAAVKSDAYKSFEKEVKPWLDVIKKRIGTIQTSFLLFPLSHTVMSRKKIISNLWLGMKSISMRQRPRAKAMFSL